jgi:Zn-dependent M28 family amino/carboxypeptidase
MKKFIVAIISSAAAVCIVAHAQNGADWEARGKRWWAHVEFLADDKLEGRDTGSAGFEKAADYVAGQFAGAGLKPAGVKGYRQPVEFVATQLDEENSSLELVRDGREEPVIFGESGFLTVNQDTAREVDAAAVFVGYALAVPELHFDDFAGLDLKGKIAVYISGGPADMPGPLKAHYQSAEERRKALRKAGAIGVASIQNPKTVEVPWERTARARFEPRMELKLEPRASRDPGYAFSMVINPERTEKFFAGSAHTFQEIVDAANSNKPLPHFALAVRFRGQISKKFSQVQSENMVGMLPGSDPALAKEYVVVSAHLDHLGIGAEVNGDRIYNGAMDDASGIASLIEIARILKESEKPKRSLLFLAVTAEEKGLLGSRYFAEHPTVDARAIVADFNMDMFLPLFPLKYLEVQGLDESSLGDDIRAVCQTAGVEVQADKMPDNNRFIRSDQYSFIRKGVPALAFKFGWLPGSPEEKTFKDWYNDRYHGPTDDLKQPVDLEGAARFNAILQTLALRVANAPQRPHWKPDSFFRRFAQ